MASYRDLKVYKLADEVETEAFQLTKEFPKSEIYSLTNQLCRATNSIVANIAEGFGRKHYQQEYVRFLTFARASCHETREHLHIAFKRGYCPESSFTILDDKLDHIGKMLTLLIKSILN